MYGCWLLFNWQFKQDKNTNKFNETMRVVLVFHDNLKLSYETHLSCTSIS